MILELTGDTTIREISEADFVYARNSNVMTFRILKNREGTTRASIDLDELNNLLVYFGGDIRREKYAKLLSINKSPKKCKPKVMIF